MSIKNLIDVHVHVGLLGNRWPEWGNMTAWYCQQTTYKIFLLFAGIPEEKVSDTFLHETLVRTIETSSVEKVVCLALDPVYDNRGNRCEAASHIWVNNEYITNRLQKDSSKVLLGASVHPYDTQFENRVKKYIDKDAVVIKWVSSAQQFNLADERVGKAMRFLAKAKDGKKPLPLLLHVGPEYALPTTDEKTFSYDFMSWSWLENVRNWFRFKKRWHIPQIEAIEKNITAALEEGAIIIFAHCGLPYFASGLFSFLEHSDFDVVRRYLEQNDKNLYPGKCYADVSALSTPFRSKYFKEVTDLPGDYLFFGSDFPTPIFEIYADNKEMLRDLKAILEGHLERAFVPQDNLLDVNYRQLRVAFPGHPMFSNFSKLIGTYSP